MTVQLIGTYVQASRALAKVAHHQLTDTYLVHAEALPLVFHDITNVWSTVGSQSTLYLKSHRSALVGLSIKSCIESQAGITTLFVVFSPIVSVHETVTESAVESLPIGHAYIVNVTSFHTQGQLVISTHRLLNVASTGIRKLRADVPVVPLLKNGLKYRLDVDVATDHCHSKSCFIEIDYNKCALRSCD